MESYEFIAMNLQPVLDMQEFDFIMYYSYLLYLFMCRYKDENDFIHNLFQKIFSLPFFYTKRTTSESQRF
jgi:hypothetical protein